MRLRIARYLLLAGLLLPGCERGGVVAPQDAGPSTSARDAMVAHSREFVRGVLPVTDNVFQAVGFGLANSMLVVGDECAFVIDVMGSVEVAGDVQQAFAAITDKPIKAFIYTHNHADHVFGGAGFETDADLAVYAHRTTEYYIDRVVNVLRPIIGARSARMFGTSLPERGPDAVINAGIGPFLEIGGDRGTVGLVRPTITLDEQLETAICGVRVQMTHAPGETNDQIFVWLPDAGVLFPGDNVYKAFPNLYTIRGTPYRDVLDWVASLDKMRALGARYLVPSHTRFVAGEDRITGILTAYRDAIQFVHDQTVRGMNAGLTPDELVDTVRLPGHLARHPYLQELYGTVAWSVRSVFDGYLGWYNGDPATLDPATPSVRAAAMQDLAGGREALLGAARDHLAEGGHAMSAELAGHLLRLDAGDDEASAVRQAALRALAAHSPSPNGRHYYLTAAMELAGTASIPSDVTLDDRVRSLVYSIPVENFLAAMPTRLDPVASEDTDLVVHFYFTDIDRRYGVHVRRGVAQLTQQMPDKPDIAITTDAQTWRRIVVGERNLAVALARGELSVDGGVPRLVTFLRLFR